MKIKETSKKSNFVPIPRKGITVELFREIEKLLPEPPQLPGYKFSHFSVVSLSQINTKDKAGNTANSVRSVFKKNGDDDPLRISLSKGIDVTKFPPILYPNSNLGDGFHRFYDLKSLDYEQWIFAIYVPDASSRSQFQFSDEEALEDLRLSMNAGDGKTPNTDEEILEHVRKRMTKEWDKNKIKKYLHTLELNLSGNKIDGLANTIDREKQRKGVVKPVTSTEAESFIEKTGVGALYFNTKAGASVERTAVAVVRSINATKSPAKICTFSSSATSHYQIDKDHDKAVEELTSLIDELMQFGLYCAILKNEGKDPVEVIGSIPQKIIKDVQMPTHIVKYGTK